MITQENFLFSGTVADNIALGNPAADRAGIEWRRPGSSAPASSSRRCPAGTTPTSGSAAGGCRQGSAS